MAHKKALQRLINWPPSSLLEGTVQHLLCQESTQQPEGLHTPRACGRGTIVQFHCTIVQIMTCNAMTKIKIKIQSCRHKKQSILYNLHGADPESTLLMNTK